ncbi:transketolase family protein [Candidatus Margulisiibacteriota bacterium]
MATDAKKIEKAATREAYGQTLLELGKKHKNIVVLDADLSSSTKTAKFAKEFPDRFFNVGVAEQDLIGTAAGLASTGKVAFASTFAMFATGRPWEQIRNTVAYTNLDVKIVATHAGLTVGEDGASHQALEDIAIMRVIPNMQVIVPADSMETEAVIRAVYKIPGPFYVRLSRSATPIFYPQNKPVDFKLGKADLLKEGKDITLMACGVMITAAMEAAELLNKEGISARVVNMSSIKPIDEKMIVKCAKETKGIVSAEEHTVYGGLGSAIAEVLLQKTPNGAPMRFVGVQGKFGESGQPDELLAKYGLTSKDIVKAAKDILKK